MFFIGGCTYSEIAALRFLSSRVDQGRGFVNLLLFFNLLLHDCNLVVS